MKLVECVPNFSEGRRKDVIEAIASEAKTRNVKVLDMESDADHNRSVLTFVGTPELVKDAALAVSAKAIELIDLNKHLGQHPRMGAVDVVPFIPITEVTMEECVKLAKEFGNEFGTRFKVPVYLYEEAASRPERRNLADVRKGEFEGLREEIGKDPNRNPDFGPLAIHPTAGATAVGARKILIAYNINLGTNDLAIAKQIAKQIRGKDGGLSFVKALGFELKDRGIVQVSMNMVDYKASQLFKVFELVCSLANRYGVPVVSSEVVGLLPMDALTDCTEFYLKLHGFNKNQILQQRLFEHDPSRLVSLDLATFASEVASEKPAPGGGSVSAYTGALSASLVSMVALLSLKKAEAQGKLSIVKAIKSNSDALQHDLLSNVDEDSKTFMHLMDAYKMQKQSEEQKQSRTVEIQNRLRKAADIPMATAKSSSEVINLAVKLAADANMNAISDLQSAVFLAHSSVLGALANVTINLPGIKDEHYRTQIQTKMEIIKKQMDVDESTFTKILDSRLHEKG